MSRTIQLVVRDIRRFVEAELRWSQGSNFQTAANRFIIGRQCTRALSFTFAASVLTCSASLRNEAPCAAPVCFSAALSAASMADVRVEARPLLRTS